jgi:hypothetical protein
VRAAAIGPIRTCTRILARSGATGGGAAGAAVTLGGSGLTTPMAPPADRSMVAGGSRSAAIFLVAARARHDVPGWPANADHGRGSQDGTNRCQEKG